jgi:hypothetical protein
MRNVRVALGVLVVLLLAQSDARAQTWVNQFPKTGTMNGTIVVDATVNLGGNL